MPKDTRLRQDYFRTFWTLLRWEGELRNNRLQQLLNLTSEHVSRLLGLFREENPQLLEQDHAQKRWMSRGTEPLPAVPIDDYLGLLHEGGDPAAWYVDARPHFQEPAPELFLLMRRACGEGTGLEVLYGSMSNPGGQRRIIYPHTIVRLSQRWHVRAWCQTREAFLDFTFGRMSQAVPTGAPPVPLPRDEAWERLVTLRLGAHRGLSPEQEAVIRQEYFGGAAARRLQVRAALLHYVIHDIRAALDPDQECPPYFQMEVLNREEVAPFLFGANM